MTPPLESLALAKVRETFPDMRRGGLRKAIRKLEPEIQPREISFIPDGWFMEVSPDVFPDGSGMHVFTCVEIEDRHPLSREKMWAYCQLWDTLEYFYHGLQLFVFDRYGLNQRQLNLGEMYFNGLMQMADRKRRLGW